MTELPWDRFSEEEELPYAPPVQVISEPELPPPPGVPEPEPEIPWIPESDLPEVQQALAEAQEIDFAALAQQSFQVALADAMPELKKNAMELLQTSVQATVKGQEIDWSHPTVTAVTVKGQELVVADAKSRSWRTLLQGLLIDLFFAVVVLLGALTHADVLDKATWTVFFVLLGKTLIQTSVSYLMRLKVTPTIKNEQGEKMALMPIPRPLTPKEQAA